MSEAIDKKIADFEIFVEFLKEKYPGISEEFKDYKIKKENSPGEGP